MTVNRALGTLSAIALASGMAGVAVASPQAAEEKPAVRRVVKRPLGQIRTEKPVPVNALKQVEKELLLPGACAAPISPRVRIGKLGLWMETTEPAVWYSLVDTIPPVGHTASITVKPVRLVSAGREVGTLMGGIVKFREVVQDVSLADESSELVAKKVQALLGRMDGMPSKELTQLRPLTVRQWQLPGAGVQVMRATIEETYSIDGIGEDTVELNGWIAVKHAAPRPANGETTVSWNTAVLDTEFVGMHLEGESPLFGSVEVTLSPDHPSRGQVGRIDIPELARVALLARLRKHEMAQSEPVAPRLTVDPQY